MPDVVYRIQWLKAFINHMFIKILCFSRYFPVANMTRTRQAVIIEPLRPEKFYVKTFNATNLYVLSICEVREIERNTWKDKIRFAINPGICASSKSRCKPQNIG